MGAQSKVPRPDLLFILGVLTLLAVGFALYTKAEVKAVVRLFGIEVSLDTNARGAH
jgi:hypothetical protein